MKKPNPKAYGLDNELWEKGGKKAYEAAYLKWAEYREKYGMQGHNRIRPIHPSWNEVLKLFDSSNPQRSQGAFCRWAGLNRASFSSKQVKPLGDDMERWILEWDAKSEKIDNGYE
jgi:hypothetical protein